MCSVSKASFETISVYDCHEQLEVFFLPIVRSRRHEQEVSGESRK